MTATPETPANEGGETNKNSETAESKPNGSTINEEKPSENTTEKEMPPNEADLGTAKAPTSSESAPLASSEDLKVKFTGGAQGKAGDEKEVKLEIFEAEKKPESDFPALTKAELMEYANDPFWKGLRWVLFVLFWLIWVAMLVTSIVIIVLAPKCPPPAPKQWWQKAPIYEVYVKSFKDSDGDGVGDIKGVTSKVEYLSELGVGSVWMSPIYESGGKDNGYDVVDHKAIDAKFGTMEDFKALLAALHDNGIKLILDFIPNHTSDKHPWFEKSKQNEEKFKDYYVWRACTSTSTPNNWKAVLGGGSAWKYDSTRNKCYLHQFYEQQPDLDLRNIHVKNELKDILKFWLDLGVDGFRVDSVAHFFEDPGFTNEGVTYNLQTEVLELLQEFREVLDAKTEADTYNPRVMMTEAYDLGDKIAAYYGKPSSIVDQIGSISHMPLNFDMITKFKPSGNDDSFDKKSGSEIVELIKSTIEGYTNILPYDNNTINAIEAFDRLPEEEKKAKSDPRTSPIGKAWPNYNIGNHDNPRAANRFGTKLLDAMNMVIMMLQGSPITYYGDEIGMSDNDKIKNPDERDPYRTPMQWDDTSNAGFSSATPWLQINDDYTTVNVAKQSDALNSHMKVYKELTKLRYSDSILYGDTKFYTNDTIFGFTRVKKGNPGYLVAVNFGKEEAIANATTLPLVPGSGTVQIRDSANNDDTRSLELDKLKLGPEEGIVIAFVPNFEHKGDEAKELVNAETAQE